MQKKEGVELHRNNGVVLDCNDMFHAELNLTLLCMLSLQL